MRILLLGKNGQLGWELRRSLAPLGKIIAWDVDELDLTRVGMIGPAVRDAKPQVIVNASAYTAVDKAEEEPEAEAVSPRLRVLGHVVIREKGAQHMVNRAFRKTQHVAQLGKGGTLGVLAKHLDNLETLVKRREYHCLLPPVSFRQKKTGPMYSRGLAKVSRDLTFPFTPCPSSNPPSPFASTDPWRFLSLSSGPYSFSYISRCGLHRHVYEAVRLPRL